MNKRVFIDMDGTIAVYEKNPIEIVARKGYFSKREPITNVIDMVKKLINWDVEVHIISSVFVDDHSITEKIGWLKRYLPQIPETNMTFVPYGIPKSEYLQQHDFVDSSDILIDDFTKNCQEWHGTAIKILNGINNTHGTWRGAVINGKSSAEELYRAVAGYILTA